MDSSRVLVDFFSVGTDGLKRKSQRNPVRVLRLLYKAGRFSVFEATDNEVIANTITWLQDNGYFEPDNSCGFPWIKVVKTVKGFELLGNTCDTPLEASSVFAFEYCPCKFESGFVVQSLHTTKAGAYKAMMKHKREHWQGERELGIDPAEIGWSEMWRVKEYSICE